VTTVAEIKEAIARLSPREYCELMAELHPYPDDEWDTPQPGLPPLS
jgi:hypothetical protein